MILTSPREVPVFRGLDDLCSNTSPFSLFYSGYNRYTIGSPLPVSDVPAPAWPESPGFGLALGGSGFVKSQAKPKAEKLAWPGLALA